MSHSPMTDAEKQVWAAAYAAAFVGELERSVAACEERNRATPGRNRLSMPSFDEAVKEISAERSICIADIAVLRLRQWSQEENPAAGEDISEFYK